MSPRPARRLGPRSWRLRFAVSRGARTRMPGESCAMTCVRSLLPTTPAFELRLAQELERRGALEGSAEDT